MKITKVEIKGIHYKRSQVFLTAKEYNKQREPQDAVMDYLIITCDDGTTGYYFGGFETNVINKVIGPELVGEDPFFHERVWQKLRAWQRLYPTITERTLRAIDCALWDICGKKCGQPVFKMLGAFRDKVPAYGSTQIGDDIPGGLNCPEAYAKFALELVKRGYPAIKIHTWMIPTTLVPDAKKDIKACAAVREAVGPDIELMLDPCHDYSRQDAYYIARELEKLNFLWMEEPMDEYSMSSFRWLTKSVDLQICGPETAVGKNRNRAEWILNDATDIGRTGDQDVGGITGAMKCVHLYESHGMSVELHGASLGNLHVLGAMGNGKYYERGMLHPLYEDYEKPAPWLNSIIDPMDNKGLVTIPSMPGLGWDINMDYIRNNQVKA